MKVALKIWRANAETGDRALRDYEVDAPEWVTLLDVLDIIKDRHDGTLARTPACCDPTDRRLGFSRPCFCYAPAIAVR